MNKYRARVFDDILSRKLSGVGAVLVEGPKWCGKTTTCERLAKSVLSMGDPSTRDKNIALSEIDINSLLKGAQPRLIDEWQIVPRFWDAVRYRVDHEDGDGHYILTGSAVPPDISEISHTGTGRIVRLRMRPMSLWESGESAGAVSLASLFAGEELKSAECPDRSLEEMCYLACRGGWPKAVCQSRDIALERAFEYYDAVVSSDISRVDGVPRDPDRVMRLMRSYARLQSTQAKLTVIRDDMIAHDADGLNEDTVRSYLEALKKIFVVEDSVAWCPCIKSKAVVRTGDTRYFVDPSVATAALAVGPGDLESDPRSFGCVFETMAVRDLRCYAEALGGRVAHYLDANGLECDAVIHLRNGQFGLVEVKLGGSKLIEEGAKTLTALASLVDETKMRRAAFRMVVTAVGAFAYTRADGVIVCPLSALRP